MQLHTPLDEVLTTRTGLRVLRVLLSALDRTWTGTELATSAGSSPPQALEALKRLERIGLVRRTTAGRAHLWSLVSEHVLATPLRSLLSLEAGLPELFLRDIREALEPLPLRRALLFGSVARRTETNDSDVDLLLELNHAASEEAVQTALTPIVMRFIRRYGVVLTPILYSRHVAAHPPNPGLMRAIERDGISLLKAPA
jgi:predicted nucleotidyltransferase